MLKTGFEGTFQHKNKPSLIRKITLSYQQAPSNLFGFNSSALPVKDPVNDCYILAAILSREIKKAGNSCTLNVFLCTLHFLDIFAF